MLAAVVILSTCLKNFTFFDAWGEIEYYPGMTMLSGSDDWKFFCIDSYELLQEAGGVQGTNEWYAYVVPSSRLSDEEVAVLFWATLSLRFGKGDSQECANAVKNINANAPAAGLSLITNPVTEADMKSIIHLKSTRDKYPWLKDVLANEETYLEMAGLLGGSGAVSTGGKPIPAVLQGHKDAATALPIDGNTFTLEFDPSGADRDFIQKVPLKFSADGSVFVPEPFDGWTYQKTDTSIIFSNPNAQPPGLLIQFDPAGTEYQSGGGYASVQDAYDRALQLWVCIECNDRHVYHSQKKLPLEAHQRLVYLIMSQMQESYYASIGGVSAGSPEGGSIQFQVYRHEEDMQSTYNVQLYKYDHETGKPLENSVFKLYERFDDQGEINQDRDGPVHIYEGGEPYKSYHTDHPVIWEGFRFVSGVSTDEDGHAAKTINHGYHYDKTFCDGHPAPKFVSVPEEEEEEDEETGETSISNESEIEAAQAENKRLAHAWLTCFSACEAYAAGDFEGVHFHWLMPEVDAGKIESISDSGGSSGETPDAGKTESASGEESYRESGCEEDCRQTYDKFISLRYSYAFVESKARDGYIRHGVHPDDLPIEIITTDASENGANAAFAGEYSDAVAGDDDVESGLADDVAERKRQADDDAVAGSASGKTEDIRFTQSREIYRQNAVRYLVPEAEGTKALDEERGEDDDCGDMWEIDLIDDINGSIATPSDSFFATPSDSSPATPSNSTLASPSNAAYRTQILFSQVPGPRSAYTGDDDDGDIGSQGAPLFQDAYRSALHSASTGEAIPSGPKDNYSHCNGSDNDHNAWRIYDHRTEGEIHINKKDMDLEAGETGAYDSYGDAQGDGTLEGAVYGLFAATDIVHPDGKTGVVYRANNLVAVAATDRNGDASFMVNTEQPGHCYDYEAGRIVLTEDGWAESAPGNLYTSNRSYDDYTADRAYERIYADNEENNGGCFIGRPLILGNYYVKELTRSEGYELSIGNRDSAITNRGQDCEIGLPVGTGYANISRSLYAEGQISAHPTGKFGDPDVNELFFTAESKGTGGNGFDVVLDPIPDGARVYRLDTGTEMKEVEVGTGVYDRIYLTNGDGSPKYVVAEHDYQHPRYNPDGSLMTEETSVNYRANQIPAMTSRPLDAAKTQKALEDAEPEMGKEEVAQKLAEDFAVNNEGNIAFIKSKAERALRANGKSTPRATVDGKVNYSTVDQSIYDTGVREGEQDDYGISGVKPGEPAAETVYGSPTVMLEIPKTDEMGQALKNGDMILTILDYYNRNSFYNYGGIHEITEDGGRYLVTVYASCGKTRADFIVLGNHPAEDSVIFHRIPYLPDDNSECPRYLYARYSNNPEEGAFGVYEDFKGGIIGGTYFASATLVTDAVAASDGSLASKTVTQNIYYKAGEIPRDESGKRIQAFEYREQTVTAMQETEVYTWVELELEETGGGKLVHMDSSYTDSYGRPHDDTVLQSYSLRVLLPVREVALTQEDLDQMSSFTGWAAGEKMGSAVYWLKGKGAKASAYLNYADLSVIGDSSFIKPVTLTYPGQEDIWQDGENRPGTNTAIVPVALQERAIRQKIRITKTIDAESYEDVNTYAQVHEDWFTRLFATKGQEARTMDNFRFKVYLKSNLERLYRDEDGFIVWMDRNGNEVDIAAYTSAFPEKVQKLYTKVSHTPEIRKRSEETVIANRKLYSFLEGVIQEDPNPGYTAVLETVSETVQDDGGNSRTIEFPDYQKFFDGIRTANMDRWDNPLSCGREFITWESWDAVRNAWEGLIDPAIPDTSYKPFARILPGTFSASEAEKSSYPAIHSGAETKNETNTSAKAKKNAMSSDAVRQFAITWYLDEEVKKLVQGNGHGETESADGTMTYQDEVYDTALYEAIKKANHYLKPFFLYDLDEIYAIEWDGEAGGGKDNDPATLCADSAAGEVYYGISAYLPYGTYVAVEQQPYNNEKGQYDFYNRHYRIDAPKEIVLPAVYEEDGDGGITEEYAGRYRYQSACSPEELAADYQIRFQEEWAKNHRDDIRGYVIRAHNASGDFEVYKYGLDVDKLTGTVDGKPYAGWKVTQDTYDPLKDYYNDPSVNTKEEGGNPDSHYYPSDEIEKRYHYASISEDGGTADGVRDWEDENGGFHFRDQVPVMKGEQTAYEGRYAPMLVPWAVTEPASDGHAASFSGYADRQFENTFYSVKLRIEKLDSETGESILHDQAIFAIYAADREDSETGQGRVKFYEEPTVITGSREFLEAMGATDLFTLARGIPDPELSKDARWYGTVPAGTPVCREEERVVLQDGKGKRTGEFRAFTTKRDGEMAAEPDRAMRKPDVVQPELTQDPGGTVADQNTGYLELPQPVGSGVYVLAEIKSPAGYARSKPVAVEIYSDRVTYYMEGDRDSRVAAAVYEDKARAYVGNTPIRLEVSKKKTDDKTVTYRLSGRVEGSVTELNGRYGLENLELAYHASGAYLGYGWRKGTIEAVAARKAAGEAVEIFYEHGVFSGYADITRPLLTAEDTNRYVAGATMTLYDAIAVKRNGDSQDYAYDGVTVERDRNSNVTRMYVKQGYAGTKIEFVKGRNVETGQDTGKDYWTYRTIPRSDTDILFYQLGNLSVLSRDSAGSIWSYDQEGKPMRVVDGVTESIYALQNNRPVFEIVSSDFHSLVYDSQAKAFTKAAADTVIYHLGADGQRDAMVDAYTGMAYVADCKGGLTGEVMVWPVTVIADSDGSVLAKHKIRTSRIATIHADTEAEYITGTYRSAGGKTFEKWLNPVLDSHGQVEYYQRSEEKYTKSNPVYDRDGDFFYDRYSDSLTEFNENAYLIKEPEMVFDKGELWDEGDNRNEPLYMRQGDNYILENTWVSGDRTPNDPFDTGVGSGQADMLKRVVPGTYIMEELSPPEGWAKAFPAGVTVEETEEIQHAELADEKIKVEISKINAPEDYRISEIDYDGVREQDRDGESHTRTEKKGAYTYLPVEGARLALYRARKIYTSDTASYPKGWYLEKTGKDPASWTVYDENNRPSVFTAVWTTAKAPLYLEGIPAGNYVLEELTAPSGYIRATAWLEVEATGKVQTFWINNDHTKLELFKYQVTGGKKEPLPNTHAAVLGLYPALTDANGKPVMEAGIPCYQDDAPVEIWTTDDCRQYTALTDLAIYEKWGVWERMKSWAGFGRARYSGFEHDYEAMYREYGPGFDELHWFYTDVPYKEGTEIPNLREGVVHLVESREADRSGCVTQMWELEDGRSIRITVAPNPSPMTGEPFTFEYQYHFKYLDGNMVSYDTPEGFHRIDYIPWDSMAQDGSGAAAYVLVEKVTPDGYEPAPPKLILLHETVDVQLYAMENRPKPTEPETPPDETKPEETTAPEPTEEPTKPEPTSPPETPDQTTEPETPAAPDEPETTAPTNPDRSSEDHREPTTAAVTTAPETETRIGRITARYDGGKRTGSGESWWDSIRLARTGDTSLGWLWLIVFAVSGVGILIGVRRIKDEKKQKGRAGFSRRCTEDEAGENGSDGVVDADHTGSDEHCQMSGSTSGDGTGNGG